MKAAKREYFTNNIENSKGDIRKTWKLINDLSSRRHRTTDVQETKTGGYSMSSAKKIAEAFNTHLTSIGESLVREIPQVDIEPESYVEPTDKKFSFFKIKEKEDRNKATGLDKIPCQILKIAADSVVPSLTLIFNQSLGTGIFPTNGNLLELRLFSKKA